MIGAAAILAVIVAGCTEVINEVMPSEPQIVIVPPPPADEEKDEEEEEPTAVFISGLWSGTIQDQGGAIIAQIWHGSITQGAGSAFQGQWSSASGLTGFFSGAVQIGERINGGFTYVDATGQCSGTMDGTANGQLIKMTVLAMAGSCAPVPTVLTVRATR